MAKKTPATKAGGSFLDKYANLIVDPKEAASRYGVLSTGSPRLDKLFGGGLPKGKISEFYGKPQSGKSTVALSTARQVIKASKDNKVLWIDLERGIDIRHPGQQSWLTTMGIDPFGGQFDLIQSPKGHPIPGEEIYELMIASTREGTHQLIVLDSMAAVVTRSELEGDVGDANFGAVAKLNSQGLKTLFALQGANLSNHIIIINQVRDQIAGGMGGLKSTGGRALEHYVGMKTRFEKGFREHTNDGDVLTPIRVRVEKSRFGPAKEANIKISSYRGVDVLSEVVEAGIEKGYIHKAGAWLALYDRVVPDDAYSTAKTPQDIPGFIFRANGDLKIKEFLLENNQLYENLYEVAVNNTQITLVEDDAE